MAAASDNASMALFCDFENIALGVRDVQYDKFDIRPVLERLLAKGSIVVKKAYCDWDRYKSFKAAMHEANFELIEIPHVRQSGKNSADIRMVVDALDLCYTKSHVDTFVIISGDSDFSPLVSKLRENAKKVIGVGVKQSCSDLLVTNCDEFIYYDDLVRDREASRGGQRREREKRSPEEEAKRSEKMAARRQKALDLVSATFADLMADRGDAERIWASVLKEVLKRRNPGFSESYFGFRTFGNLLEEAASQGILVVGRDDKSGTYVTRGGNRPADAETPVGEADFAVDLPESDKMLSTPSVPNESSLSSDEGKSGGRRRGGRRNRKEGKTASDPALADNRRQEEQAPRSAEFSPEASDAALPEVVDLAAHETPEVQTASPDFVPELSDTAENRLVDLVEPAPAKEKARRSTTTRRPRKKADAGKVPTSTDEASVGQAEAKAEDAGQVSQSSESVAPDIAVDRPKTEKTPAKRATRSRKPKKADDSAAS